MRKLFAVFLLATLPLGANELSYTSLQSGWGPGSGRTPVTDHGIHGEGQIIAILDTGLDYDNCYFAEPDGSAPPINTGTPSGGLQSSNVNLARRKVIAYDFLYSCTQFPGAPDCDDPKNPLAYDDGLHGTHAGGAAVGDHLTPIVHDYADAIATGAKLVVQDAGLSTSDQCTYRPGIGCPPDMTPILTQAYAQGARIHSNSWGDRQGVPYPLPSPAANYTQASADIDAFVYAHPDMLVVFDTGNFSANATPPNSSAASPGTSKNVIQVGGTRTMTSDDSVLAPYTLFGPSRDGRIKPDLVGPAYVLAADSDGDVSSKHCDLSFQGGTSWSAPSVAGAAALVRQYYTDGYYPSGFPTPTDRFNPSAALLKATLIAAARQVPQRATANGNIDALPVPSKEQGWGFPVLDDALYFPGDKSHLRAIDVPLSSGLGVNQTASTSVQVNAGTPLKVVLVWTDPAGTPRNDGAPQLVNDLDLRVTTPAGSTLLGNGGTQPDRLNNVEAVSIPTPTSGTYTIAVSAARLGFGARQSYALVITGDTSATTAPARTRAARH
jgi:Subtilase family